MKSGVLLFPSFIVSIGRGREDLKAPSDIYPDEA